MRSQYRRLLCAVLSALCLCSCAVHPDTGETLAPTVSQQTLPHQTQSPTQAPTQPLPTQPPLPQYSVASTQELALLAAQEALTPGSRIRLSAGMQITEPITFFVPVSILAEGEIFCEYPIVLQTMQSGSIAIEGDAQTLLLSIDAPSCDVYWSGNSLPEESAAQLWNVGSYNGVDLTEEYGLGGTGTTRLLSVWAEAEDNDGLDAPLQWHAQGNTFSLAVSYLVEDAALKNATVRLVTDDGQSTCVQMDLTQTQYYTVEDSEGGCRVYKITTERITYNLPVVYIDIKDGQEVSSREEYLIASIRIDTANAYGSFPELEPTRIQIRGRGHYSWRFDKTPYKLHFPQKTSVLGMAPSKNWVLLANYTDRSLIQNYVALEMGKVMTNIPYHSSQYPVDVFVNGSYRGVYTLGEQLEAKPERMDLEESYTEVDTDYLLEVGGSDDGDVSGQDYFHGKTLFFVSIKHPDSDKLTQQQLAHLKDYVAKAEKAVAALDGYEEYIDVDSLIDWVIIHELTYNLDCCFRRSCYLIKEAGGKLKMGPIWDFDLAFGNFYRYEAGDWATVGEDGGYVGITWMNYLIRDPEFLARLTDRWNEIKEELLDTALTAVDEMSALVSPSAQLNFTVWDILGKKIPSQPEAHNQYDTYEKMVGRLRAFLEERYAWLDRELNG